MCTYSRKSITVIAVVMVYLIILNINLEISLIDMCKKVSSTKLFPMYTYQLQLPSEKQWIDALRIVVIFFHLFL